MSKIFYEMKFTAFSMEQILFGTNSLIGKNPMNPRIDYKCTINANTMVIQGYCTVYSGSVKTIIMYISF